MTSPDAQPPALLRRWERLSAPRQAMLGFGTIAAGLLVLHLLLFPNLTVVRSITYAVGEAVPITGFVLLATATEQARRVREQVARRQLTDLADGEGDLEVPPVEPPHGDVQAGVPRHDV